MTIQYANGPVFLNPTAFLPGTLVAQAQPGVYGVQLPSGLYLSVQPNGAYETRPAVGGSYEQFTIDPSVNVLHVNPGVPYSIAYKGV